MEDAKPPVAREEASSPSSSRTRRTIASTWPGEPVDHARLDRGLGGAADDLLGLRDVHERKACRALRERLQRDLDARRDDPSQVIAVLGHGVVGDGGAEVDHDARSLAALVGGHGIDQPVWADLTRVLDPNGHPDPERGADDQKSAVEITPRHLVVLVGQLGHHRGADAGVDVLEREARERQQAADLDRQLIGGGVANRDEAPVLLEVLALEDADVRLGVPYVDREQHRTIIARF